MYSEAEPGGRKVPTLVQYCQRVAAAHINSFERLGEGWPEALIQPVLNSCSAETLWRLEEHDPYVSEYTEDMWKTLCTKTYPLLYRDLGESGSESWKDEFARCKEENEERLEKAAANLRVKRQRDEERKKETSIKITDKLPPAKRARWGVSAQPKTLFQKTRSEAAKLQKGVFSARMSRPNFQRRAIVSNPASAKPPPPSMPTLAASGSRVTVRAVAVPRKPSTANTAPDVLVKGVAGRTRPIVPSSSHSAGPSSSSAASPPAASPPQVPSSPPDGRSPPPPPLRPPPKKNPASALFMPKHRAYSQLPRGVQSKS
ncbi:hypothetical protein BD414DRAFT_491295 [Trametes punicea]|nr:hypothetical protein BD414DRAFT_491295 [Trametes punicea]